MSSEIEPQRISLVMAKAHPEARLSARRGFPTLYAAIVAGALVMGALLVAFVGLGAPPLYQPHEALYAEVAREMLQEGNWAVPYYNYSIYADKPPLFYWLTMPGLALFGNTEFGARFGLAAFGLLEVVLIYFLGRLLYGNRAGVMAAAALTCSLGHIVFSRMMLLDIPFSACLTATFLFFSLGYVEARWRWFYWTLAGACCGLAVLTKSLIGLVFPGLALGLFVVVTRQWKLWRQRAVAGGILGFLVVALPWHLYMVLKVPGFANLYFWNEQVLRFLNKRQPMDFDGMPLSLFLLGLLIWALPWGMCIPHVAWLFRRRETDGSRREELARYLPWLWAASVVGFFALSSGRLIYYSLPALPALALLLGWFWSGAEDRDSRALRWSLAGAFLLVALIGIPCFLVLPKLCEFVTADLQNRMLEPLIAIGACIVIGALLAMVASLRGRYRRAFWVLCLSMVATAFPISTAFEEFGDYHSLRSLLPTIKNQLSSDDLVIHRGVEDDNSEAAFYLQRQVSILKRQGEFVQPILGKRDGYYVSEDELMRLWSSDRPVFLMVSHRRPDGFVEERPPPGATILAQTSEAYISCNPAAAQRLGRLSSVLQETNAVPAADTSATQDS